MKRFLLIFTLVLSSVTVFADEGMWMVNMIDKALEKKMKDAGCTLPANVIYDETKGGITDAIVSLDFECSGSFISKDGLVITNHHCAYSDICRLSTTKNNYLEKGFWAFRRDMEIPVPERNFYILRKVIDITDEARHVIDSLDLGNKMMGMRRLSSILEKKYGKEMPEFECSLYKMYAGKEYYMMAYEVYHDVRLVAAPPASIASFGGDIDNWDWPQHKGDFAIYRVYTGKKGENAKFSNENIPYHPRKVLKIDTKGVKEGDFTMTLGFPGMTSRYISSYEVDALGKSLYPLEAQLKKERMNIMWKWMNIDENTRLKYSETYFALSNVQEIREWQAICYEKDKVTQIFTLGREKHVSKGLLDSLDRRYNASLTIDEQIKYFQETVVRGGKLWNWSILCTRDSSNIEKKKAFLSKVDLRLEREIFLLNMKEVRDKIEPQFWGEYLTKVFTEHPDLPGIWMWDNSSLATDKPETAGPNDPIAKAYDSMKMLNFRKEETRIDNEYAGKDGDKLSVLNRKYKWALYEYNVANGIPQYPDANSSMRLSYGNVAMLNTMDGVYYDWKTTSKGILEKENPDDYNFTLKREFSALLRSGDWGKWADSNGKLIVDFITTNDITGGNSGSAVLNAKGELIGLAFDGNKEGLSCDVYYNPKLNRCVCVDIRYVLWVLDKYAGMTTLVDEILK